MNGRQNDICLKEIGLRVQHSSIVLELTINVNWGIVRAINEVKNIHFDNK